MYTDVYKLYKAFPNTNHVLLRINTPQVLERVATLFKGQPTMIRQFMQFLPPGHVLQSADVEKSDAQPIYVLTPAGSRIVIDPSTGTIQT